MSGNVVRQQTVGFSSSLHKSIFGNVDAQKDLKVSLFGIDFSPQSLSVILYSFFVAVGLSMILLVVAVKRQIQHVNVIAHSSLVVILASLLWMW